VDVPIIVVDSKPVENAHGRKPLALILYGLLMARCCCSESKGLCVVNADGTQERKDIGR